jgi:hypothetical protein
MGLVFMDLEIINVNDLVMIRFHLMDAGIQINILVDTVSQS